MPIEKSKPLAAGEWVEIRSPAEIQATLDNRGRTDNVPFMPEMLALCGRRFRVFKRAHKTCDTVTWTGLRELDRVVHLALLRCAGTGHGGCQAGCMLFWHEAWLQRVTDGDPPGAGGARGGGSRGFPPAEIEALRREVERHARREVDGETIYTCQATSLLEFTRPLAWWKPRQYWRDMRYNGVRPWQVLRGVAIAAYNTVQRWRKRPIYPNVRGNLKRTPSERLDLQAGEWVEVKSREEIVATLDGNAKNRGMTFDAEMLPYCGKKYRVLRRVETIVEEATGKLVKLPNPCIILEGSICTAIYHRYCPRAAFPFWREIWLRRVDAPLDANAPAPACEPPVEA